MSLLSNLGSSLVTTLTGVDTATIQSEVTAAEQQLTLAVQTIIGLEAVLVVETFLVVVLLWSKKAS